MEKKGKLELTWVGKYEEEKLEPRILIEDKSKSYGDPDTENMLIHGDNLLALKALQQEYAEKIKCIYIDPPYNTGSAFETYDDCLEHSTWLSLMKERLIILRCLLSDEGSLWISIDDDEHAYLKVLCDEIFGRNNYISSIVWQKRISPDMRSIISDGHEYILVYAKNKDIFKESRNLLPLQGKQLETYKNPDNDPRGAWTSTPCHAQAGHGTASQFYELIAPNGKKYNPPSGRCWLYTEPVMKEKISEGRIYFGKDGNGVPRKKTYLSESKGVTPWTWWTNNEVGTSLEGKKESQLLFGSENAFPTPKPERLIERIISIASNSGDYVLDSFLGSGTTAAVAHKMNRKWIGIEMEETCYSNCKVRIDKIIDNEDLGGITQEVNWQGGGGYKFYELAEPLLVKNKVLPIYQINPSYTWDMVCEAICKIEGFTYEPYGEFQGHSSEKRFIHITEEFVNTKYVLSIMKNLGDKQSLLIYCKKNQADMMLPENVEVKKIPKDLLDKCNFESEVQE